MTTSTVEIKSMDKPDEAQDVPRGRISACTVGGAKITLVHLRPGWTWQRSMQPIAGTQTCQVPHTQYVIAGRLEIVMDDGDQHTVAPGDVVHIEPGHLARVLGDEDFISIEFDPAMAGQFG